MTKNTRLEPTWTGKHQRPMPGSRVLLHTPVPCGFPSHP
jgi:hypothetical protein